MTRNRASFYKMQNLIAALLGVLLAIVILLFLPSLFTLLGATTLTVAGAATGVTVKYILLRAIPRSRKRLQKNLDADSIKITDGILHIGTNSNVDVILDDLINLSVAYEKLRPEMELNEALAEELDNTLSCSVFAPPAAAPGDEILVQAYAHIKGSERTALALAAVSADPGTTYRASKDFNVNVPYASKLGFHLSMRNFEIDEPDQEIIWNGSPEGVSFIVKIPEDLPPQSIAGKLIVTKAGIPIGHISFILPVVQRASNQQIKAAPVESVGTLSRYRLAFISYASKDREEVLPRVQALAAARIKVFQDILDLEPGERWEKGLYKHIDECDAFFLFWSEAAKESIWVQKEALYAYDRQAGKDNATPEIIPIIIEGPPPVAPPPELSFLHFNDKFIYLMAGVKVEIEARQKQV